MGGLGVLDLNIQPSPRGNWFDPSRLFQQNETNNGGFVQAVGRDLYAMSDAGGRREADGAGLHVERRSR